MDRRIIPTTLENDKVPRVRYENTGRTKWPYEILKDRLQAYKRTFNEEEVCTLTYEGFVTVLTCILVG